MPAPVDDIAAPSGAGAWGELLRAPGVARLVISGLVARLPSGMASLGLVLLVRGEGFSYAAAGAVGAAGAVAGAVGTPLLGRLVDVVGQTRVLAVTGVAFAAAVSLVIALAQGGAGLGTLIAAAALAGVLLPPISACVRALWPEIVPRAELKGTAFALEASLQELFYLLGPLLVASVAVLASPAAALGLAAAAGGLGTLAFAAHPASRAWVPGDRGVGWGPATLVGDDPPHLGRRRLGLRRRRPRRAGALRSPGIRVIALVCLGMGTAFGAVELSMPAFGEHHGSRAAGGLGLAAMSLGSLLGGVWTGARPAPLHPSRRLRVALAGLGLAMAGPALAGSIPAIMALGFLAGVPIAPAFACLYGMVDDLAPPGATTEAFAWVSTMVALGVGCGTSLAGVVVEPVGFAAGFAISSAAGFAALLVALGGGRWLRPAEPLHTQT